MNLLEQELKVNPFEGEKWESSETEEEISPVRDELVERTLEIYSSLTPMEWASDEKDRIGGLELDVLDPCQINVFLHNAIKKKKTSKNQCLIGLFATKLIQNSHNAGNNKFMLSAYDSQLYSIGVELIGKPDRPILISIEGNIGRYCFREAKWCEIQLNGNTVYTIGAYSHNCTYNLYGNAPSQLTSATHNCTYTFFGTLTPANDRYLTISENNVYRTTNPVAFRKLKKRLDKSNTVQLIDSAGKILEVFKK